MKLYVKYMVSIRCRLIAKDALVQLGYPYCVTSKGIINLPQNLLASHRKELSAILRASGMVLLDKKKSHLVDKIDQVLDASLQREKPMKPEKIPQLLEKEVGEKFAALANLISEVNNRTIVLRPSILSLGLQLSNPKEFRIQNFYFTPIRNKL